MRDVVIVSAKRSPIGSFGGSLKNVSAVDLGATVLEAALREIDLQPEEVDEIILGNVLSGGLGQNISRQVGIKAGIPERSSAFTVNKVCGSGLKSIVLAAQSIMLGDNDVVVAGGTENMSQANYVLSNQRFGQRMGHGEMIDTLLSDGLTDAFSKEHMGLTAENIADTFDYTRKMQDEFSVKSQNKAELAVKSGRFNDEIVEINVPVRKGNPIIFKEDEFPRFGTTIDKLEKLQPAFKKEGTVTAGNASGVNDGAAILILMSREKAEDLNLNIMATISSYASAGVSPDMMGTGPIPATKKALEKAGLGVSDLDLVEGNEAFASQAMSVIDGLELDESITNVNGGAIALGHPIGASGARILVSLLHEMKKRDAKIGLATLCIGGGQGLSLIVKRD